MAKKIIEEVAQIRDCVLGYLSKKCPDIQTYRAITTSTGKRLVVDGILQGNNMNRIFRVAIASHESSVPNLSTELFAAGYVEGRTQKPTDVFCYVITDTKELKVALTELYKKSFANYENVTIFVDTIDNFKQ